jgi:Insecticidal Crystal Toxin, P42
MSNAQQVATSGHPAINAAGPAPTLIEENAISNPDAAAAAAVHAAIAAGNYPTNGVNYAPFQVKFAYASSFNPVWWDMRFVGAPRPATVTFFQFSDRTTGNFLPLGDVLTTTGAGESGPLLPLDGGVMLFAPTPDDPGALAHPTGFEWILDDHGSGNFQNLSYWRPIPPNGYQALGMCFGSGAPDPSRYWCVKNDYLKAVSLQALWSDEGQGWSHNGNVNTPAFSNKIETVPEGQMLMIPRVCLSAESSGAVSPWALVVAQARLPVSRFPPPDPAFDPAIKANATTTFGLGEVFIVPYTAVAGDAGFPNRAVASPFYFVAAEPYWLCTKTRSTPSGGSQTSSVTVGVSQTQSTTFQETTTLSVSAEFGAKFKSFSGKVSATYTRAFQLTTATSQTDSTQVVESETLNTPKQPTTWFWALQTQIAMFRTGGSQITPISYGNDDQRMVPEAPGEKA